MKIKRKSTSETVSIEDGFFWLDEFDHNDKEQTLERAIDGTAHIQEGVKQGTRPMTLQSVDQTMGWVSLAQAKTLKAWSALPKGEEFEVQFEFAHDSRKFDCIFNHTEKAIEISYIKGIPPSSNDDPVNLTLRFWSN